MVISNLMDSILIECGYKVVDQFLLNYIQFYETMVLIHVLKTKNKRILFETI